jgi:hypothetical protein
MARTREDYVRPPVLAREPAPRWQAVWRFRAVAILAVLLMGFLLYEFVLPLLNGEGNPGL